MSRLRPLLARAPLAAYLCAAVALVNGVAWTLLVPPFHIPDETAHVGYVQHVAEGGGLPQFRDAPQYSAEERELIAALDFHRVAGADVNRPIWTDVEEARVRAVEKRADLERRGNGSVESASSNPPLYYLLLVAPYHANPSDDLLDRLVVMRLFSTLIAALTVFAIVLFLRELLPGTPWAWTVGGLAAALQPMFGFLSGGINNDNLLFLVSACLFLALARAFRRGLTVRRGVTIGAIVAAGLLTKHTFLGLLPGIALALLLLAFRDGTERRERVRGLVAAVAAAACVMVPYTVVTEVVSDRAPLVESNPTVTAAPGSGDKSLREELSFIWQLWLPRAPWMHDQLDGFPLADRWMSGMIGRFGWIDYGFSDSVYSAGRWTLLVVFVLALIALARRGGALMRRVPELVSYAAIAAGLMFLIGVADYNAAHNETPRFEQFRYLLPLLPLYAAVVALASRAGGRRLAPLIGGAIVSIALAHTICSQLLTITRYYG